MENIDFDCIIGIDPGSNGGIATWVPGAKVKTIKMPRNIADIREYLRYIKDISSRPIIFLEKMQLRMDDIDSPGKAFRIQQLLASFQQLKDYISVEDVPYILVHPMSWQAYLKLRKEKEEKKDRKNRYKQAAEHYYPEVKATLWNADAILLMHFGRLKIKNEPKWIRQNLPSEVYGRISFPESENKRK